MWRFGSRTYWLKHARSLLVVLFDGDRAAGPYAVDLRGDRIDDRRAGHFSTVRAQSVESHLVSRDEENVPSHGIPIRKCDV